jgi:ferredoxin
MFISGTSERRRAQMGKVDQPTTRIVSEPERFDQGETVFARAFRGELGGRVSMIPSEDVFSRIFILGPRPENSFTVHMFGATDGPVNPERVDVSDPGAMSQRIKEVGKFLGADLIGISELNQAYAYSHSMVRLEGAKQGPEVELGHRYAISVGVQMDYHKIKASPSYIDAAETGLAYSKVAKTVCQLAAYIRELGYPARAHHVAHEQVLHVPIAVDSGLGELGRLGFLITKDFGPRLRLGTVTTDLPLAPDRPVDIGIQDSCEKCRKCATNCPSQSIPTEGKTLVRGAEKWQIRPDLCYHFWHSNPTKHGPCAVCIKVCPWNKPPKWYHVAAAWVASHSSLARTLLLWLDDLLYGNRPRYKVKWLSY